MSQTNTNSSEVNTLLAACDLTNHAERLMLADVFEEADRAGEAQILRSGAAIFVAEDRVYSIEAVKQQLEEQLDRFGVLVSDEQPCGAVVYFDDDLPASWCRITDDDGEYANGPALEILEALCKGEPVPQDFHGDEEARADEAAENFSRCLSNFDSTSNDLAMHVQANSRDAGVEEPEGYTLFRWLSNDQHWAYGFEYSDTVEYLFGYDNPYWTVKKLLDAVRDDQCQQQS